jgi:CRISPR type I-E-associated protein CasA/Cse1
MCSFDLLTEKWIPALDLNNSLQEYGIVDLLHKASELTRINESSPFMEFGIYRFLIALTKDIFKLNSFEELETIIDQGKFDFSAISAYMNVWKDRFNLFDKEYPFYQGKMLEQLQGKEKPISNLIQHIPSGTNVIHFNHVFESNFAISPKVAAKALCALPPFMTMGGSGFSPSINGAPPVYTLIRGKNLFETIVFNCLTESLNIPLNNRDDPPFWRSNFEFMPKMEHPAGSILLGLTWQPRYVHLLPLKKDGVCMYSGEKSSILIGQMYFEPGLKPTGSWVDPHVAYRKTSDGIKPFRQLEARPLWRDYGGLLILNEIGSDFSSPLPKGVSIQRQKPAIISQFEHLRVNEYIDRDTPLLVSIYSIRTDMKAKIFEWQKDVLGLPFGIILNPSAGLFIENIISQADKIDGLLKYAIKKLYPRDGKSNKNAFKNIQTLASIKFWQELRMIFEKSILPQILSQINDREKEISLKSHWLTESKRIGRRILDDIVRYMDNDAQMIQRQVMSKFSFEMELIKIEVI